MEIILASSNSHKVEEVNKLLTPELSIKNASDSLEIEESGQTFSENAFLKAKTYFEKFNKPTLSDDSGLVLEDFPMLLGVHSARFKSEISDYQQKCLEVIKLYDDTQEYKRRAFFVCVLCLYLSPDEFFFFEGRSHGKISAR